MDSLYPIGKVLSTHGYKGHLKIRILKYELKDCNALQSFFLLENEKHLPYFIESIKFTKDNEALVKLEDVHTKESAAHLKAKEIFVHKRDIIDEVSNSEELSWLDYTLNDSNVGDLGSIINVFEFPAQLMIQIIYKKNEKLIPLHDDFIDEIDHENKQIQVTLPEGLLDI